MVLISGDTFMKKGRVWCGIDSKHDRSTSFFVFASTQRGLSLFSWWALHIPKLACCFLRIEMVLWNEQHQCTVCYELWHIYYLLWHKSVTESCSINQVLTRLNVLVACIIVVCHIFFTNCWPSLLSESIHTTNNNVIIFSQCVFPSGGIPT